MSALPLLPYYLCALLILAMVPVALQVVKLRNQA